MKLPIILESKIKNKNINGFIMMEIILAFSLFILFTVSIFSLKFSFKNLKIWSIDELNTLKNSVKEFDGYLSIGMIGHDFSFSNYGNFSKLISNDSFKIVKSNLIDSWGSANCSARINFQGSKSNYYPNGIFLGSGNKSTDTVVRNSIVYLTANSSIQAQSDFFVIDAHDYSNLNIISSLNTGPGLSAITVAGPYAYVANSSSVSQLQIIDIHDRQNPFVLSQLKIPLPTATTTAPKASSIFYKNGYVYLGTYKWDGPEFYIINVLNPSHPIIIGSYKTNTLVNSIYVDNDKAYLATSNISQMIILDLYDKTNPISIYSFSPSGWQTQEGKILDLFEGILTLGRTVGGFNNISNHEAFIFPTTTSKNYTSRDIPGGVYGSLMRNSYIYLITHSFGNEFQIWDSTLTNKIFERSLGITPVKMSCDWSNLYFSTGDENGISILTL